MSGVVVVLSTVGRAEDADRIARALVEERLAACVNVVRGLVSVYRWKDAVEREEELLLVIKTRAERARDLEARLLALHPYELPEVLVVPVAGGHAKYVDWIRGSVR